MNRGTWMVTAVALIGLLPAALAGQQPTPAPAPRPMPAPRAQAFTVTVNDNRGRIGVVVNATANAETDKYGAKIDAVSPGGPADRAGLKAGDIITRFNGTSLAGAASADDEDSGPGQRLIELAHRLNPGDTVRVEYRRGTETKPLTLVAEDLDPESFNRVFVRSGEPEARGFAWTPGPMVAGGDGQQMAFCFGDAWCELDLVKLNADLGEYFGTREGILVVRAPADSSAIPLKSGDVIVAIGGRKPTSPSHAMRILRSYEVGETVTIDILRKQKRVSLSYKIPPERTWWKMEGHREPGQPSGFFNFRVPAPDVEVMPHMEEMLRRMRIEAAPEIRLRVPAERPTRAQRV